MLEYDIFFDGDPDEPKISSYEYNLLYDAHMALLEEVLKKKHNWLKTLKGEFVPDQQTQEKQIVKCESEINSLNQQKISTKIARNRSYLKD